MGITGLMDRRDIDFLVREVLDVEQLFSFEAFKEQSWEMWDMVFDQAWRFAHEIVDPTNAIGDREGVRFSDGEVTTPDAFKPLHKAFLEGGWIALAEPEAIGGMGMPRVLAIHASALFSGGNAAYFTLPGLNHGVVEMVQAFGSDAQKARYLDPLLSGEWAGTMCLTEAGAGSDVGALRAVAYPQPDGSYHIKGTKIFITWGEHDLTEQIIYPVLARIEGDPPGSGGISLFLVDKYRAGEQGGLGARNGVKCTGIEHKMGIHGSPTCVIELGEDEPAVGELLGAPRRGLRAMFKMMNTARIAVGLQSLALAEAAYRYAHQYALDRIQGAPIERFKDPTAPRVPIVRHPDVRRMLLEMRGTVEGLRALLGYAALQADLCKALEGDAAAAAEDLLSLLTPLCKGYASEVGFEAAHTAVLVLGGHGFLRDHPVEQYVRDSVIARLYEGTTGIQAMDLLGRKLGMKGGSVMMRLLGLMDDTIRAAREVELGDLADRLQEMRGALGMTAMGLGQRFAGGDIQGPLLNAVPMMHLMGDTVLSWLHLKMAVSAITVAEPTSFHRNKLHTARHYICQALGRVRGRAIAIEAKDRSALEFEFEAE